MWKKENRDGENMLEGFRVIDLSDEKGLLCSKALADMGADVIVVEPPQGSPLRRMPPFYQDDPDLEKSLFWWVYNTNKRAVTLNPQSADGRELLRRLIATADILVESAQPGHMSSLGLGYEDLRSIKPGLVYTSITPFGQSGPHKDFTASDLTCWAMSGFAYITGDADRPPVQISVPQAYLTGSLEAATATMIALYHRELTGRGQHVDVSIQASGTRNMMNAPLFWEAEGKNLGRAGPYRLGLSVSGGQRVIWPCRDGEISFFMWGGKTGYRINRALTQWMDEEGMALDSMKEMDWSQFDMSTASEETMTSFGEAIAKFYRKHTRAELFAEAQKRGATLYPVQTMEDLVNEPQLAARQAWQKVEHPELGIELLYLRPPYILSEAKTIQAKRAPFLGEHNREIYEKELGLASLQIAAFKESGVI